MPPAARAPAGAAVLRRLPLPPPPLLLLLLGALPWAALGADGGPQLGARVVAIDTLNVSGRLGQVVVPAGTEGVVDGNDTRLVVDWALPQALSAPTRPGLVDSAACLGACNGLLQPYLAEAAAAARNSSLSQAQRCVAFQGHAAAAACALSTALEAACPALSAHVAAQSQACLAIGVDIAVEGQADGLFYDVFALEGLSYATPTGQVAVPPGTQGTIVAAGVRLVVAWHLDEARDVDGVVNSSQVENASCLGECQGLLAYLSAASEAFADATLTPSDRCLALGDHADAAACGLAPQQRWVCPSVAGLLERHVEGCKALGIDLLHPAPARYEATVCTYCSYLSGAEDLSGDRVPRYYMLPPADCESRCTATLACQAYDYDLPNRRCRLWRTCPLHSQRRSSCGWTLYERRAPEYQDLPAANASGSDQLRASSSRRGRWPSPLALSLAAAAAAAAADALR